MNDVSGRLYRALLADNATLSDDDNLRVLRKHLILG
jgi:hypothetical protein